MRFNTVLAALIVCCIFPAQIHTARILSIFPFPGPSHYIIGSALLKGLVEKGHEVTSISTYPQKNPIKNFRDVPILESLGLTKEFMTDLEGMRKKSFATQINVIYEIGLKMCANVMENAEVQELLKSPDEKFDLIIIENFATESLYGLAEHFNAPIVGVSTFGAIGFVDALVGNTSPVSYVPHLYLPFTSKMSFWERLINFGTITFDYIHYNYWYLPRQKAMFEHYFPNSKVQFDVLIKSTSLVLLNQHFSVSYARPYVPNMIEVGGLHIKRQPDPLPQDMQEFLDNATEGAIYFSMGSNLKSKDLSAEKLKVFLNTFRDLKLKVLWKFENTKLPDKPNNVFISSWYPQPSILSHPNVKVFISHGGLLSTTEALFHAKPMLGLPMFADQPMNIANAVRSGYALSIDFNELNEDAFKSALNELLNNSRYTTTVKALSKRYRDQPIAPLDKAIYWVEYVLRHDGALHLRNAGIDLALWQYHSLDTFCVLFACILVLFVLLIVFIYMCVGFVLGEKLNRKRKLKRK